MATGKAIAPVESREIALPGIGTLIDLNDLPSVAYGIDQLRTLKRNVDLALADLTDAVKNHTIEQGTKTMRAGDFVVKFSDSDEISWDVTELQKLRKAGLPEDRYAELVTEVVSYKVNGSVARQIEGSNPKYARIIKRARVRHPKRPSASVEPA